MPPIESVLIGLYCITVFVSYHLYKQALFIEDTLVSGFPPWTPWQFATSSVSSFVVVVIAVFVPVVNMGITVWFLILAKRALTEAQRAAD